MLKKLVVKIFSVNGAHVSHTKLDLHNLLPSEQFLEKLSQTSRVLQISVKPAIDLIAPLAVTSRSHEPPPLPSARWPPAENDAAAPSEPAPFRKKENKRNSHQPERVHLLGRPPDDGLPERRGAAPGRLLVHHRPGQPQVALVHRSLAPGSVFGVSGAIISVDDARPTGVRESAARPRRKGPAGSGDIRGLRLAVGADAPFRCSFRRR